MLYIVVKRCELLIERVLYKCLLLLLLQLETNREVKCSQVSFTACADRRKDIDALNSSISWLRKIETLGFGAL